MTSKKIDVLIVTHDVRLNQTFTNRYNSFNRTLNQAGYKSKILGFSFPFKPHPNNSLKKENQIFDDFESFQVEVLNPVQKLILLADNWNLSFSKKKVILALHFFLFSIDQWSVNKRNLNKAYLKSTIVIAGGAGGIIQTASYLADKYDAKLILDYRDPWNFGYHLLETNPLIYNFKRYFTLKKEFLFLKKANHIVTVSESLKSFFPQEFQQKITVIENGSNYEFELIKHKINPKPNQFNIVYLGTIYNDQLLDETFFIAIKEFVKINKVNDSKLKIYFIGSKLNKKLTKTVKKYELEAFSLITERLNKEEVSFYLENASMFLHLRYGNRSQIITSKDADYLMFKKPILVPVSDYGDLEESIKKYKAGYVCNGIEETINALEEEYAKFVNKENITLNNGDFSFLSRSEISKKLITIIENLKD